MTYFTSLREAEAYCCATAWNCDIQYTYRIAGITYWACGILTDES